MNDDIFEVDFEELQKQRADEIRNSGNYVEFNVLIGTENDEVEKELEEKGIAGCRIPVIQTAVKGDAGSQEIAHLYITLRQFINDLIENYPAECIYGESAITASLTHIKKDTEEEEKEENED